jgi:hypothetical protein
VVRQAEVEQDDVDVAGEQFEGLLTRAGVPYVDAVPSQDGAQRRGYAQVVLDHEQLHRVSSSRGPPGLWDGSSKQTCGFLPRVCDTQPSVIRS